LPAQPRATHNRSNGDDEGGSEKRMGQLIAETLPARVLRDEAEVRAATTLITVDVWASIYAGIPGRHACFIRLAGERQTGQRHSHQTEAESFESLTPGYGFRHSFCQLIEFVAHDFFLSLF
jgi:hypothetical protein